MKKDKEVLPKNDKSSDIRGIPVELLSLDDETGEVCIGDDCFQIKIEQDGAITFEYNPEAQSCSLKTKAIAKKFLKQIIEGKTKIRFRKIEEER